MTVENVILETARTLASEADTVENAVVLYEDGHALRLKGSRYGVAIPLVTNHGRAVAVIHTHPVPRTSPSLPDLRVLFSMAKLGVPSPKLVTVYSEGNTALVTVYTARAPLPPDIEELLTKHALDYEFMNIQSGFDPKVSEKQVREQHALLSRLGVSVERYKIKIAS